MSDIFREVDEEIRRERYKSLWDRFGLWVIAVAVIIVVGTAGYRGWIYWKEEQAKSAGDLFLNAVALSEDGKHEETKQAFAELEGTAGGYPMLARMRSATDLALAGDKEGALAAFEAIAADGALAGIYRDIARLRAGYMAIDLGDFDRAADNLEAIAGDDNPWRFLAREALAVSAWKAGDLAATRSRLEGVIGQEGVSSDVESRARRLLDLVNAVQGTPKEGSDS